MVHLSNTGVTTGCESWGFVFDTALQSKADGTTWSLLVMCLNTSYVALSHGKDSKLQRNDKNMNESAKRKCPHP